MDENHEDRDGRDEADFSAAPLRMASSPPVRGRSPLLHQQSPQRQQPPLTVNIAAASNDDLVPNLHTSPLAAASSSSAPYFTPLSSSGPSIPSVAGGGSYSKPPNVRRRSAPSAGLLGALFADRDSETERVEHEIPTAGGHEPLLYQRGHGSVSGRYPGSLSTSADAAMGPSLSQRASYASGRSRDNSFLESPATPDGARDLEAGHREGLSHQSNPRAVPRRGHSGSVEFSYRELDLKPFNPGSATTSDVGANTPRRPLSHRSSATELPPHVEERPPPSIPPASTKPQPQPSPPGAVHLPHHHAHPVDDRRRPSTLDALQQLNLSLISQAGANKRDPSLTRGTSVVISPATPRSLDGLPVMDGEDDLDVAEIVGSVGSGSGSERGRKRGRKGGRRESPLRRVASDDEHEREDGDGEHHHSYAGLGVSHPNGSYGSVGEYHNGNGAGLNIQDDVGERRPLLAGQRRRRSQGNGGGYGGGKGSWAGYLARLPHKVVRGAKEFQVSYLTVSNAKDCGWAALTSLPAVVLGLILNLLDALSYGIIIFPNSGFSIPASATQAGISMFLASTVVCQVVFALGGSSFKGANGSMMIEVMPFLYIMVQEIEKRAQGESPETVLATIMVAYAMSTILTGVVFLLLGIFRLGNLIQFFPRHILVGCIGGIGWFLFVTGIEVTTGLKPEMSLTFLGDVFKPHNLMLWGAALAVAMTLKLLQRKIHHALFVPMFYVTIPIVFYAIVLISGVSLAKLRELGWLFAGPGDGEDVPFWTFWTYFNKFQGIHWGALPSTFGTQLALVFFAVLHVPINVPALAVSTHQPVDVNHEIIGHGLSNLCAGFIGVPQNYLVYSNSVLYMRSGGNSTIGGLMLAGATAIIWIYGDKVIGFVPTVVVGSLIFHLAYDLMKESIWDTRNGGISVWEYSTILLIVVVMAVFGFTEGILAGMILACFFFVIMYSRRSIIRGSYKGTEVRSNVHRPYRQKMFLDSVGDQVRILKLQGFMFFGVISQLESYLEQLLVDHPKTRFVVLEFGLITGVDYSALEAFHRLKRLLIEHQVHLIFCEMGAIASDLAQSGIFSEHDPDVPHPSLESGGPGGETKVHSFESLNQALEFCENSLLVTFFRVKVEKEEAEVSGGLVDVGMTGASSGSPRMTELRKVASRILKDDRKLLTDAAQWGLDCDGMRLIASRFERIEVPRGTVLWKMGQEATEFYVIESGELLQMVPNQGRMEVIETLLPGTMVGELEVFSSRQHNGRLVVGGDSAGEVATLWRMTRDTFDEFSKEHASIAMLFVRVACGFDCTRFASYISLRR
ncbi:hypothetical protein HK101_008690 [Irineochytrium annulatum]|nr:hypothetical protein HK101_008690 [Irineochytrium annulatum]